MTKRRVVLTLVLCSLMALLAVQALSEARSSRAFAAERSRGISDAERKREIEKQRKETKLARERRKRELKKRSAERKRQDAEKAKELAKEGRGQRLKRFREKAAERRKEFLHQKSALGASEEQWKLIKAKLEKVRLLSKQANSAVGVSLARASASGTSRRTGAITNVPVWQWKDPWKGKTSDELTEAQRLAKQLVALVERKSTTPKAFRRKMVALRKARSEETELNRQLSEVRRELREILTIRQEAALVLMKWL